MMGRFVDGNAPNVGADQLELTHVDAGAYVEALANRAWHQRGGAVERACRAVERQHPVAGGLDLLPPYWSNAPRASSKCADRSWRQRSSPISGRVVGAQR